MRSRPLVLLGVLAAFMTHEVTSMFRDVGLMRTALKTVNVRALPQTDRASFEAARTATETAFGALESHIEYVRRFASNVRRRPTERYKARAAIRQVIRQFQYFSEPRHIAVEEALPAALLAPPIPLSVYSGLILNLYTNALKALLAKKDGGERRLLVEAAEDDGTHVVRVSDTGIGVAPSLQSRVFDPLFSTTDEDGPLGPGMGLGLYIVRRVLRSYKGQVRLVSPIDGFTTTFELRLPNA